MCKVVRNKNLKQYNKLVRDKIPEIIENSGRVFKTHIADRVEYEKMLKAKLLEEVSEFIETPCIEELADVDEVLEAIRKHFKYEKAELERVSTRKRIERGGFEEKIILEYVE